MRVDACVCGHPLRNAEHSSAQELFVCCGFECVCSLFVCACKSPGRFCNWGAHRPSHVSHYCLADSVIGDTKLPVVFQSYCYALCICGKDIWLSLISWYFKEERQKKERKGVEDGGWIKKKKKHLYTSESDSAKGCTKISFEMLLTACPNQILYTGGPGAELVKVCLCCLCRYAGLRTTLRDFRLTRICRKENAVVKSLTSLAASTTSHQNLCSCMPVWDFGGT